MCFTIFSLWSVDFIVLRPVVRQRASWMGADNRTELLPSWWPGRQGREGWRKRGRQAGRDRQKDRYRETEQGPNMPFRTSPSDLTSFQKVPLSKDLKILSSALNATGGLKAFIIWETFKTQAVISL